MKVDAEWVSRVIEGVGRRRTLNWQAPNLLVPQANPSGGAVSLLQVDPVYPSGPG